LLHTLDKTAECAKSHGSAEKTSRPTIPSEIGSFMEPGLCRLSQSVRPRKYSLRSTALLQEYFSSSAKRTE
jgi:hypothetical protein